MDFTQKFYLCIKQFLYIITHIFAKKHLTQILYLGRSYWLENVY